jgi:outer membrane protein TolC
MKKITKQIFFITFGLLYPVLSNGQELDPTLKELINKGISKSHLVKINNFESDKAKIDQNLAKSVFIPKITLNGSYTKLDSDITLDESTQALLTGTQKLLIKEYVGIPFNVPLPASVAVEEIPIIQSENILKASADLEWILFSGFQAYNALEASKHKQAAINFKGLAEKENIAINIIDTYDKLALVINSSKVLITTETYLQSQESYVNKAIKNGLATPLARKKIEIAQQQLIAKQLQFENSKLLLIEVLHQLTGEEVAILSAIDYKLQTITYGNDSNTEVRNEIKALEEAKQATNYKSKMEANNFIPKIAVKGHYEFVDRNLSLLDPKWYVAVGVKWNVFNGFESKLRSDKTTIDTYKYQEQINQAEEMIALSIIKHELDYSSTIQNTIVVQKELELSDETYKITINQYKNGLTSLNEVLDALNNIEKSNFKLQRSYYNERRAFIDLLHAKGIFNY